MKRFVVGLLAVFGVISIIGIAVISGLTLLSLLAKPGVPSSVILEVDFEGGVIESVPEDAVAQWMLEDSTKIRDVVDALDRGAADRRVVGLVAKVGGSGIGLAHLQEIRDAVGRFRASGKPAIAYAETFGEFSSGNGGYYLATAFDRIYLQPSGDVGLTGLIYESTFLRGLLDKLGVVPEMDQRHEYKNAMNSYTDTGFTEPHREALDSLMRSQFDQIVRGVAEGRGLEVDAVRALIDQGPFLGARALEHGLVDELAYRDEVHAAMRERTGERAKFLFLDAYLERAGRPNQRGTTVALIHGYGAVIRGSSGFSPLDGSVYMGSETVGAALRAAIEDSRVEAIVFRVDSPGGSYVASDTIWRETVRARDAGKPLIVSMGNLAGSGGYFVAMEADKIVAEPGTITASIGVYGGKLVTEALWRKFGITYDGVQAGANAGIYSPLHEYTESEDARVQAGLDRIYEDFTAKVAAGRDLPLETVLELARGRIYTGETALGLGLVDALGGVDVALDLAREALELEVDAPLKVKRFPASRSALDRLLSVGPDRSQQLAWRSLAEALREAGPAVRALRRIAGAAADDPLAMPLSGYTEP